MSHLNAMKSTIRNVDALIAALIRMGFTRDQIEVHEKVQALFGYHGTEDHKMGHVIIRKQNAKIPSDIGWERDKDGCFVSHVDDYDYSNSAFRSCGGGNKIRYDKTWENKLYTYCNVEVSKIAGLAKGIKYTERLDNKGRIQLVGKFVVPSSSMVKSIS